ncbi:MAG: cytochrome P450 [Myxococcales bacterium]|nr:cytochrome P450 [Myxococcales bacterium]MCB9713130.1 cytochrome P450 [Myxococcales bacterium]
MLKLPKLPPTDIRGPKRAAVMGTLGNVLSFFREPIGTMLSLQQRFGNLVAIADRDPAMLVAFGGEHNRAVLSDTRLFHHWSEIPIPVPPDSAPMRLGQSLISTNGETHRRNRRLMMPAFAKGRIERYLPDIVDVTEQALARIEPGATVDLAAAMVELSMHVALRCLFGVEPEPGTPHVGVLAGRYTKALLSPGAIMFPYSLPGTPYRRFLQTASELEDSLRALVARRRHHPGGADVLSALIDAHDDEDGSLTDGELVGQAALLFIAGHETTAFTLSWTLFLLSQHPRVMQELGEEIEATLRGAPPTADQLGSMPRLDAVIKESQRLFPATPFMFFRRATAPFELGGHELPEGASVILSPLISHRLPEVFPEPKRFRPERWEGRQPTLYEYLPFGAGPRMCIGAGFASQTLRVVLPMLLSRIRPSLVSGAKVSRKVAGVTMGPRYGLPMRIMAPGDALPAPEAVPGDVHELVELG